MRTLSCLLVCVLVWLLVIADGIDDWRQRRRLKAYLDRMKAKVEG